MPRRRGRPPLDADDPAPSVSVSLKLSARQYDEVYARARDARLSVPEFMRHVLGATRRSSTPGRSDPDDE